MSGLDVTNESLVGVDLGKMNVAVNDLGDIGKEFTNWCDQLITLKDLVAKDWLGGAQDTFSSSYQQLVEAMMKTIDLANNLQNHGMDTMDVMSGMDTDMAQATEEALRIGL